ncbi:hypothetical protein [Marinobacter sp. F3R11]|uniref:hypothetical protein n=1 Tax=Marinobacter sp. F3R11 TaxID=2267231 RepID=UPI000DE84FF5|nr:hypothetical protein [Marinobacter sp. F3R11]RBW48126.1 hypothetical protein DS878_14795 [Marinobacter sp. F3R11]
MSGRDVFLASTPFQLLGCAEARSYYAVEQPLLVIVRPDNKTTEQQMAFLVAKLAWSGEVVWLPKRLFYIRIWLLLRRLKSEPLNRLFVGNKGSWMHEIFFRVLVPSKILFLDDGLGATVLYYDAAKRGIVASKISNRKGRLLAMMGIRLAPLRKIKMTFFTCFPLSSIESVDIVQHHFQVFRGLFGLNQHQTDSPKGRGVGYLGQNHGKQALLERLREHLLYLKGRHPDAGLVYFMHRKQRPELLAPYFQGIPVRMQSNSMPIEIAMALSDDRLEAFYGFTSTALFSLKKLFPDLSVYRISDEGVSDAIHHPEELWQILDHAGVETVEFNPDGSVV